MNGSHIKSIQATGRSAAALTRQVFWPAPDFCRYTKKISANMLIIFDNDGTICDTQKVEGKCYAKAIKNVLNISLSTLDWTKYPEATSSAIVQTLLKEKSGAKKKEQAIKNAFLKYLKEEQPKYPGDFTPIQGVTSFIQMLQESPNYSIAIATGCFFNTAQFKLECCGINIDEFPHATSCDTPKRNDVLSLAVERANGNLKNAVYFGDAPWDVAVSKRLNIGFIGIGRKTSILQGLGASYTFRDYSNPERIIKALDILKNDPTKSWQQNK